MLTKKINYEKKLKDNFLSLKLCDTLQAIKKYKSKNRNKQTEPIM
jgi:hypothetical protein